MDANFTINVIDPNPPVTPDTDPVVPDTDPIVPSTDGTDTIVPSTSTTTPDTGIFSGNLNSATSIVSTVLIILSILTILSLVLYKLNKKQNLKRHILSILNKKKLITSLTILTLITSISTFTILANTTDYNNKVNAEGNTNSSETEDTDTLAIEVSPIELNVTLDPDNDEGVYAVTENSVTIKDSTLAGFTAYAYVTGTDLYLDGNTEDEEHRISIVSENLFELHTLAPNTWGITSGSALDEGHTPADKIWWRTPIEPLLLDSIESSTEAGYKIPTWSLYFGAYITPDLVNKDTHEGYGTYSGVTISYTAIANPIESIDDLTYLQDFNKLSSTERDAVLSSMTPNSQYTLKDSRDNTDYTISKIENNDGTYSRVWMTQNLKLDLDANRNKLTTDNTNNPTSDFLTKLASTTDNSGSSNKWCTAFTNDCIDQILYNTDNIGDNNYDSYGVYYNWYTATVGNGIYEMEASNALGDICPAGWHLPSGAIGGEFFDLNRTINSGSNSSPVNLIASPANFVYSGAWSNNSTLLRDSYGYYWSRSAYTYNQADSLDFSSLHVNPGTGHNYKYYGFAVRCIFGS